MEVVSNSNLLVEGEEMLIEVSSSSEDESQEVSENFFSVNKTENQAVSYSLEGHDPRVSILMKFVRGIPLADPKKKKDSEKHVEFLLEKSWEVDPLDTLKLIFYTRDCRNGKGEKLIFRACCRWLLKNHKEDLRANLKHIPFYGTWKDPLQTFGGTKLEKEVIHLHALQLLSDESKLNSPEKSTIDVGAAKYAPSEGCAFDRRWKMVSKFTKEMKISKSTYRKKFLRPLRSCKFPIVEEKMCAKKWDEINFSAVPSVAGKMYKKTFNKHCQERYSEYLKNVMSGKAKINTSVLTPVDIVNGYIGYGSGDVKAVDETREAQWKCMVSDLRKRREKFENPANALCVVDVSGSMWTGGSQGGPQPIHVSIALGLIISLLNDETSPFHRKWITFSSNPKMEEFKGESLNDMISNMDTQNWEMTTNIQAVFDMILGMGKMLSVPQEKMPQMLIIISDMQFNQASREGKTNWEDIERKYSEAGYTRPTIVFWNVRAGTSDMPLPHSEVPNCALLGGYSANLLDPLMDGIVPDPIFILRKILDNPRYDRIELAKVEGDWKDGEVEGKEEEVL